MPKRLLYGAICYDHRVTLYCGARFDKNRVVELSPCFVVAAHDDRARRAETEHIVAAWNFGRAFKGRKCAETNAEFRFMEADLHNLAPAIGAVNAAQRRLWLH